MRQMLLASVATIALIGAAAADERKSSLSAQTDSHIRVVAYSPTRRTEVVGLVAQPTTITFPANESVYRVVQTEALDTKGESVAAAWKGPNPDQVKDAPLGNNLTLWPLRPGITIMNVTTMLEHGGQKSYPFKLVAKADPSGKPDDPEAVFNVIFKGGATAPAVESTPAAPAAPLQTAASAAPSAPLQTASMSIGGAAGAPKKLTRAQRRTARQQNEAELAADRLRTDSFNRAGGCHYHGQGDANSPIKPLCPLDNGTWTLMRFPGLSVKPTVYVGVCDGTNEHLARQHGEGDFVVVEEIAASFCLRLFPSAVNIINDAWNPIGNPPNTGTITPGVQRQILSSQAQ